MSDQAISLTKVGGYHRNAWVGFTEIVNETILFTITWSIVLFISTFSNVISADDKASSFNGDVSLTLVMPCVIVLALYLWEEAYNVNRNAIFYSAFKTQIKHTLILLAFSVISINIIGLVPGYWKLFPLLFGWLLISSIKYITLKYNNLPIEITTV